MSRDNYTASVTCPKCEQKGTLHLSAADGYAYHRDPTVVVEKVEGNFEAITLWL
jgi:hypothetical protein